MSTPRKSNSGAILWQKAKSLIPGGNQLLSKRSEMYLPSLWPSYYSKALGCEVWDLDNNHYYDFAQMGVGTCTLGYADEDVNAAVATAITNGNMSTLNCAEEVTLAEQLVELHPWAEMARFARTGGEACTIAVRIARAASGRDKIAFCGYHGWHDWYLSSNLVDENNLDGQLLPGLSPAGVPKGLAGTALPFGYNDSQSLKYLFEQHKGEIGVIIMEPQRGEDPAEGFLDEVRQLADDNNAVLIFDEITSGFRVNFGGIHLTHKVEPDIAVFGKGISNGYPCAAIIGRKSVMDAAQNTFISSTYWTERIGPAAALATLKKMKALDVQSELTTIGQSISEGLRLAAAETELNFNVSGIPPLLHFGFDRADGQALRTLYTEKMLDRGFLAGPSVYATIAYNEKIISQYLSASAEVFSELENLAQEGSAESQLQGEIAHKGFKRLA